MFNIEYIASALSIVGAIFMSFSKRDDLRPLYIAFILFYLSDLFFIYIFLDDSLFPLVFQMFIFLLTALKGIYIISSNKFRDLFFIILSLFVFIYFIFDINIKDINYDLNYIEIFASSLAVFGSFLLGSYSINKRLFAFILFFIADFILIYVAYKHELYGFMVQSMFFLITSLYGIYNLKLKKENLKFILDIITLKKLKNKE
jgi:nicotinamide riboside transporter PnuC